jgi:uroporphyrin-3 C-methyltransferase
MTDPLPTAPTPELEAPPASRPAPVPPSGAPHHPARAGVILAALAGVVALVALLAVTLLWQRVSDTQRQLARQSTDAGNRSVEARTLAQQAADVSRENTAQLAALQSRVNDLSAYRAQLDELVQSVARARDESMAAELEAALRLAQDQAQLTGSVEPLLAALNLAQRRLARATDPRLAPVSNAVARDLERVKTASIPDTAGLLARIDQLLRQVDDLPAANGVGPGRDELAHHRAAADAHAAKPAKKADGKEPSLSGWQRVQQWLALSVWQPMTQQAAALVRVGRVDQPEAMMMAPDQVFFVRENLKLRLQGARLALLARQYEAARADLAAAQTALGTWFDPAARRTQAAATLLQQIQNQTRSADLPRIDASLLALGNAQAAIDAVRK